MRREAEAPGAAGEIAVTSWRTGNQAAQDAETQGVPIQTYAPPAPPPPSAPQLLASPSLAAPMVAGKMARESRYM